MNKQKCWILAALISVRVAVAQPASRPTAELLFTNANIYTLESARPRAEALAVADGRIVAIGSAAEVLASRGAQTRVVDLQGRTVLPGLIDAHGHMQNLGSFALGRLDLSTAKSYDEVIAMVRAKAEQTPPGQWILGGRWDHESWPDRALPTHPALSEATAQHPVWLRRVDGHAGLANAEALRRAGLTRDSRNPAGGELLRDSEGELTGVLVDNAMDLIQPEGGDAGTRELLLAAQKLCLAAGLTGVHDAGVSPADVQIYQELATGGELKLRVYGMLSAPYAVQYFRENPPLIGERITVRSAKLYVDGAMGSRGAWLLEPYSDRATDDNGRPYVGLAVMNPDFIRVIADDGLRRGYQVCTHAIGDRGNREVLDAYAAALAGRPNADARFRVEHAQLLSAADIPRFAQLGVIASMQPTHCTSDMRWVEARVGAQRAAGAYAWASLLRSGATIAAGSDFPVESHNPFLGIYAAITRQDASGAPAGGWRPEQRLTREEAIRAFTIGAAQAAFEEHHKGTLKAGKLADFVVLDRDVMLCEPRELLETRVLRTVIGGETVFEAGR